MGKVLTKPYIKNIKVRFCKIMSCGYVIMSCFSMMIHEGLHGFGVTAVKFLPKMREC